MIAQAPRADATQLDLLAGLISPRVGVIRSLNRRVKSCDEPPLPIIYDALIAHYDFRKNEGIERGSCGKGLTDESAMLGAIGEAIEHYCASHPALKQMHRAAASALGEEWVDPNEFVLFSQHQYARKDFPFHRWSPQDEIPWIQMRELPSLKLIWVPAMFVYLNYRGEQPQDFLCAATSSGLAAGVTLEGALRSAILELLERDAFLNTWMNRLTVPEIDYSNVQGAIAEIQSSYKRSGIEIKAFQLATDMPVCAVMALALDHTGAGPAAIIGLGCDLRPSEALRKAIFEIGQMHEPLRKRFSEGKADRLNAYADVGTLEEHAAYFFRDDHLCELKFLIDHGKRVFLDDLPDHPERSPQEDCDLLAAGIRQSGNRLLYLDLTTPDLAGYPIRVLRALITQLQPIHFGHGLERLGGRRLYELPRILGFTTVPSSEGSLNPCPHPLA